MDGRHVFLEHVLLHRLRQLHRSEPAHVGRRPGSLAGIDKAIPQQEGFELMPRPGLRAFGVFARTAKIADGFVFGVRYVDRFQLASTMQPGQHLGIAPVGLDPVAGALRDTRGRHHGAVDATRCEVSMQGVAAGAGFVNHVQRPAFAHELPEHPIHVRQAAADGPIVAHLAPRPGDCQGNVNRILVYVHPDVNCARLGHDLPPIVQRCALVPTLWLGAEPLRATHVTPGGRSPHVKP